MTTSGCGCVSATCACGSATCGCCAGVQPLTPASECNRPGLTSIRYRVGTHAQFFESMKARLSTVPVDGVAADGKTAITFRPLVGLTTRDPGDPSIALLDSWACVGDVLSFYQERIANEGYLRTATERRSVLELSRLVGYTLRPGVASTVYLAYTIDDKQTDPVTIAAGARSQSVPGPGEKPQSFEASDDLEARAAWNSLKPRLARPQSQAHIFSESGFRIYLKGTDTNLKVNDALLISRTVGGVPTPYRVRQVQPDAANARTLVMFSDWPAPSGTAATAAPKATVTAAAALLSRSSAESATIGTGETVDGVFGSVKLIEGLNLPPSIPPRGTLNLQRSLGTTFTTGADIAPQLLSTVQPRLRETLAAALANAPASDGSTMQVFALRVKAAPFGNVAPKNITQTTPTVRVAEWGLTDLTGNEFTTVINLDAAYDRILPDSWIVIDTGAVDWKDQTDIHLPLGGQTLTVAKAGTVSVNLARAAYGMSGKTTRIDLTDASNKPLLWWDITVPQVQVAAKMAATATPPPDISFQLIRRTAVYAQPEELTLADEPLISDICGGATTWIELDSYYSDLKSGRWAIVSGERTDVTAIDSTGAQVVIPGVAGTELVMLSEVIQDVAQSDGTPSTHSRPDSKAVPVPGDKLHTFVRFAKDLEYCYRRDRVTINGNVVKATHGESRSETLGSGDGSKVLQSFTLKQAPLTYVAAPTPVGADSTLRAYVNDMQWLETESLAWLGPKDRGFVTQTDDAGNTTLVFGDGQHGARLPTGQLNVKAGYRNGIGKPGNVQAGQISLLQTRPVGVKAVVNPMRASGGADKETADLARESAPLSVMPLDRLVSVQDYADFTRRFAGIAKALARKTTDGRRELLYLTIAGVDDIPIDPTSDLYHNLLEALRDFGDPDLSLRVDLRELQILVLSAGIKIAPDRLWEKVAPAVRARLLDQFGFGKRALGQWVVESELISAIQNVDGVTYVDVTAFGAIPERVTDKIAPDLLVRRLRTPAEIISAVTDLLNPSPPTVPDQMASAVSVWPGGSRDGLLIPAGLAIFVPTIPDTLILNQIQ